MDDLANRVPAARVDSSSAPSPAASSGPLPESRRAVSLLLRPFIFVWRQPRRALLVVMLLLLIGLTTGVSAAILWTRYQLHAARQAVERGHHTVALQHLRSCRLFFQDAPEVTLLAARVARRTGNWDEAESLLDDYWRQ